MVRQDGVSFVYSETALAQRVDTKWTLGKKFRREKILITNSFATLLKLKFLNKNLKKNNNCRRNIMQCTCDSTSRFLRWDTLKETASQASTGHTK